MNTIISVKGAEFVAYHGFFESERNTGHTFIVDVDITTQYIAEEDDLGDTINYQEVYNIIADEMKKPQKLLETVLQNIINRCYNDFPKLIKIVAKINKLQPQLGGRVASTQIIMEK